jgi:hypothetical protein
MNPLLRHSRAGGNPVIKNSQSEQNLGVVPLHGDYSINWIPACAGMTLFSA